MNCLEEENIFFLKISSNGSLDKRPRLNCHLESRQDRCFDAHSMYHSGYYLHWLTVCAPNWVALLLLDCQWWDEHVIPTLWSNLQHHRADCQQYWFHLQQWCDHQLSAHHNDRLGCPVSICLLNFMRLVICVKFCN